MLLSSLMIVSAVMAAPGSPELEDAMPARVLGLWTVEIGPGSVETPTGEIILVEAHSFSIVPPDTIKIRGEAHAKVPVFNPKAGGWRKGYRPKELITVECSATYALIPETLKIYAEGKGQTPYILGKDYDLDPVWATFGRIEGGAIGAEDTVLIDYDYHPERVDSIVYTQQGLQYLRGEQGVGVIDLPEVPNQATVLANVWLPNNADRLVDEYLLPIDYGYTPAVPESPSAAERFFPKTLAKLEAGETVTIVAFGDSVTNGGGVENQPEAKYQNVFLKRLQAKYPKATIILKNAAWGGASSKRYMDEPRGGTYDYIRDVLEPKPDLVTFEFVNDAYMDAATMESQYGKILSDIEGVGGELVLIAPHFTRKDWMPTETIKTLDDPRHYVQDLRKWAQKNDVAVADAADLWCNLWRIGVPYPTLLANSINHPDARGHMLFADALMALFPGE